MNEVTRDEVRRKVTSVGNSWIVCKSKSHPGHVYYFNSLTGEAAWNLSDAEIEKAKQRTKHLECLPGVQPVKCPEPKDKPPSTILNNCKPPQTLVNEPVIINRVTEQQSSVFNYSNFANSNATLCTNNLSQVSGVLQDTQMNNLAAVKPVQLIPFNNPIGTYNLNTTTSIFNPKVWDIPQTQQIFVAPTMAPLLNNNTSNVNFGYNNLSQPMPGLFLNNIEKLSQIKQEVMARESRVFHPREHIYGQRGHRGINKRNVFTNKNDLRQKLAARKRFNGKQSSFPEGSGTIRNNARKPETSNHDGASYDQEGDWINGTMESFHSETQLQEAPSKINVMPLKCLAPSDARPDAWLIIVDLGVLLNEFKFLNTLTDSDEKCHLMVPGRVMAELETYVTCTENIKARRILRFLSHQIEIGYAYMAEEPSNVQGDSMVDVILKTCEELLENKYHLILISDDNEILTKASSNINMFSTDEIKNLLLDNSNKPIESSVLKKPLMVDELINKIKIMVPNNTSQTTETIINQQEVHSKKQNIAREIHNRKPNNTQDITEECVSMKRTVDTGIQTDFEDINACTRNSNTVGQQTQNVASEIPQSIKEKSKTLPEPSVLNIPEKRREIKLKCSTSNQTPNPDSKKKQFKWRRRRDTAPTPNEQKPPESPKNTRDAIQTDFTSGQDVPSGHNENIYLDESIGSRESSIYTDIRNSTAKENITIEETSTSGIISNTESVVDAESNYSNLTTNQQPSLLNGQSSKKPMYEVDSISMEEYLKMKCDEWVSRFIQIMEEALSQVLQQDPPFMHKAMPPPWTLHEAAQCVAIKFSSHQDITVAANKLSNILFNVSDAKGKIKMNMAPYQYMQMYSYGLHLLAAIRKVTSSCEDVQIAVDSLNKLLHDIRNPNLDGNTNDTFNDTIHGNVSSNALAYSDMQYNNDVSSLLEQEAVQSDSHKQSESSEQEIHTPVKFIRKINIDSSFFKNSIYHKNNAVNNSVVERNNSAKSNLQSFKEEHSKMTQAVEMNNTQTVKEASVKADEPTIKPNIVRKFTICPEREAKMNGNDENSSLQRNDGNSNKTKGIVDTKKNLQPRDLEVDSLIIDENTKKFKYMMCMLLQEIKEALCQAKSLCDQCYKELRKPKQSTKLKRELQKKAERAHLHITGLHRSLESMLDREKNPSEGICNLLKQADINISHVDAGLLNEYRSSVAKCKNHANAFLNAIQNIISDLNT